MVTWVLAMMAPAIGLLGICLLLWPVRDGRSRLEQGWAEVASHRARQHEKPPAS